jgi:hypothetical protein
MSIAPTARRIETWGSRTTDNIPVTMLRPGDLVFDTDGMAHPLASVDAGTDSSVWVQRQDLPYVEHLTGTILIARRQRVAEPHFDR